MNESDYEEIDLIEILRSIYKNKMLFLFVLFATASFITVISFILTPVYQADVVIAPASSSSMSTVGSISNKLGGLASIVGIGGAGNADQNSISMATLVSREITRNFITENKLLPVMYPDSWDKENKKWLPGEEPNLWTAVNYFEKDIRSVTTDKETGIITLSIRWPEPNLSAQWANKLVQNANSVMRKQYIKESIRNINFLKEQAKNTENSDIKNLFYTLIQEEIKNQMLATGRVEYAYKIIDPATPPKKPIQPKKIIFLISGVILGVILGTFTCWYWEYRKNSVQE